MPPFRRVSNALRYQISPDSNRTVTMFDHEAGEREMSNVVLSPQSRELLHRPSAHAAHGRLRFGLVCSCLPIQYIKQPYYYTRLYL
jgi:hypothetical protein